MWIWLPPSSTRIRYTVSLFFPVMFHSPKSHVWVKQIIREWLPYVWSEPDSSCKTRMHPAMSFSVWPFVLAALDTVYGGIKISAWQCTCVPGQGTKTSTNISLLYSSFLSPSPNNKCLIFFLERTQRVIHGPATFEFCHVTSGVLQRSVLSPRLFTCFHVVTFYVKIKWVFTASPLIPII